MDRRMHLTMGKLFSSFLSSTLVALGLVAIALAFKLPVKSVPIIFTTFFILDRFF